MPLPRVRKRTLASGAMLGGALLFGLALIGGVGDAPGPFEQRAPERPGPVTAVQPQLREALLTDRDLPPAPAPAPARQPRPAQPSEPTGAAAVPGPPQPAPVPGPVPAPETSAVAELCRALFEDPDELSPVWQTPPQETISRSTDRHGATLHQVLGVFDGDRAVEAYEQLRESATGCDRVKAALSDGAPVTVLLQELTADRRESATADDTFTMLITLEDGTPTGWLSVDRIGPVVSVLHHLGASGDRQDITQTRHAALTKLRLLLRTLRHLQD